MSTEPDYQVVRYRPDLLDDVISIHAAIYGPGADGPHWQTKFDTAALGHEVIGYLAYAPDGQPAAYYGVFPITVTNGGREYLAAQSGDTMTHPDHQGKGLFRRLGQQTYQTAEDEGIDFVFGFPNQFSYPGFVKHLRWTHTRTVRGFVGLVPTLPLGELAARRPQWRKRIGRLRERALAASRLARPVDGGPLTSSVLADGRGGVRRDDAFGHYKAEGLHSFTQSGTTVYFKVRRYLEVGDVVVAPGSRPWAALLRLVAIALVTGTVRVSFYATPDSALDRLLRRKLPSRDAVPYGHVAFQPSIDPDDFDFTFIDFDTF